MHIIDNFLPQPLFNELVAKVENENFPWFYADYVSSETDAVDFYFIHTLYYEYQYKPNSNMFSMLEPVLNLIQPKAIIRSRVLSYIGKNDLVEHGKHVDFEWPQKLHIDFQCVVNHSWRVGTKISRCPLLLMALTMPAFSMSSTSRAARL